MKCVDFHLHQEPIAGRYADSRRSSSAAVLGTREMGRKAVHGAAGTLLVEKDRVFCWEWVGAKMEKGFFGVRWASGRSRRSFGKCQQWQEWERTWWASRVAPKWRRVGCCSQRQGIIRPRRIIIPPVTPVLNREARSVMALPATLWSGPETPVAFGQNLWEKKLWKNFFFCVKVHWTGLGEGKGEQSACKEQDHRSTCAVYGKKKTATKKGNVWKWQVCVSSWKSWREAKVAWVYTRMTWS